MGEIEEHLGITINQISSDFVVPVNEFDGKVIYGCKNSDKGKTSFAFFLLLIFTLAYYKL